VSIPKHENFKVSVSLKLDGLKSCMDNLCQSLERMGYQTATIIEHRDPRLFGGETTSITIQVFKDNQKVLTRKVYTKGYGGNVYYWNEYKLFVMHDLGLEVGKLGQVNIWAAA